MLSGVSKVAVAVMALTPCCSLPVASADLPSMNGVFVAQYDGVQTQWRVGSSCNQAGCFAYVASDQGWNQVAQLGGNRWVMVWVSRPEGFVCPDGSTAPSNTTWDWDAESLTGTVEVSHGAACGSPPIPPGSATTSLHLIKVA
jgi:hypothetical protein